MPRGSKPGERRGGRKKGTPNKSTVARAEELAAGGELPRDYMLRVMRDPSVDHSRRDDMAKSVAPYVHARLQATTLEGKDGGPIVLSWKEPHPA